MQKRKDRSLAAPRISHPDQVQLVARSKATIARYRRKLSACRVVLWPIVDACLPYWSTTFSPPKHPSYRCKFVGSNPDRLTCSRQFDLHDLCRRNAGCLRSLKFDPDKKRRGRNTATPSRAIHSFFAQSPYTTANASLASALCAAAVG